MGRRDRIAGALVALALTPLISRSVIADQRKGHFEDQIISFDLPDKAWGCFSDGPDWYCRPGNSRDDELVTVAEKISGMDDHVEDFEAVDHVYSRLSKSYSLTDVNGKPLLPEKGRANVVRVVGRQIGVEASYQSAGSSRSQTRALYTRVAARVAILVTMSARGQAGADLPGRFLKLKQSIRLNDVCGKQILHIRDANADLIGNNPLLAWWLGGGKDFATVPAVPLKSESLYVPGQCLWPDDGKPHHPQVVFPNGQSP